MIKDIAILAKRLIRNALKMPFFIVLSLSQPLMYLLLFGSLFSNLSPELSNSPYSYITFLTPGMIILAAMFGSAYIGMNAIQDINKEFLDRIIVSSVRRVAIPASYVVGNFPSIILQMLILVLFGVVFGNYPAGGLEGIFLNGAVAILVSLFFGSLSVALAFATRQQEPILGIMNFITLPLMFTSNMMISNSKMPNWIERIAHFNPVNWAVTLARASYNGTVAENFWIPFIYLLLLTMGAIILMLLSFKRYLKQR